MSVAKKLLLSSIVRTTSTITSIVIGFFMMPFLIRSLGDHDYGLWILTGGLVASLYLFDFGFSSAVIRFFTLYKAKDDHQNANCVINTSLAIYTGLGLLIILAGIILTALAPVFAKTPETVPTIRLLILISCTTIALEFPFKAFAGVIQADLRYDLVSYNQIFIMLASAGLIVYFIGQGHGVVTLALIGFATQLLSNLIYFVIAKSVYRDMRLTFNLISKSMLKELFGFSIWTFTFDLSRLARQKGDILVIAAYLSPALLTIYYVGQRLSTYISEILSRAVNVTAPLFTSDFAKGDFSGLKNKTAILTQIHLTISAFTLTGALLFGSSLIKLWIGNSFDYRSAYLVFLILLAGKLIAFTSIPYGSILMAVSKQKVQGLIGIGESVSSILIMLAIALTEKLTLPLVALSIVGPFLVSRLILFPLFALKSIGEPLLKHYLRLGWVALKTAALMSLFTFVTHRIIGIHPISSYIIFLWYVLGFSAATLPFLWFCFDSSGRNFLKPHIKSLVAKKFKGQSPKSSSGHL